MTDADTIRQLVREVLQEGGTIGPELDRRARIADARDSFGQFLKDASAPRGDRTPSAVDWVNAPVHYEDVSLPLETFSLDTSPAPFAPGGTAAETIAYPSADGYYVLNVDTGVVTWVKLDEIEVADCSSGTTVTRKFLALPAP